MLVCAARCAGTLGDAGGGPLGTTSRDRGVLEAPLGTYGAWAPGAGTGRHRTLEAAGAGRTPTG